MHSFYDDHLTVDLSFNKGSGQRAYLDLCSLTGKVLDSEKHEKMGPSVIFTGCELDLSRVFSSGSMTLAPKPGRLENVVELMSELRRSLKCSPAQAATLLGKCGYIGSQLQGRVLRFAERPLIERQYDRSGDYVLSDRLQACLAFVECAFERLPPKAVPMGGDDPLAIIYSDAAFQEGSPITFGWVLFLKGQRPRAGAGVVPAELSRQFKERKTQIFIGELLGALSALYSCGHSIERHRLLHFVDNQGALAALIGGFSTDTDTSAVACAYQLLVATLGVRVWFEYVESEANISDGPSRLGLAWGQTREALQLGVTMEEASLPQVEHLGSAPLCMLEAAFSARRVLALDHSSGSTVSVPARAAGAVTAS